jgi:hypothetical protein
MDQGPLVTEQIDAGKRFLVEYQKYVPVQVAFWLKESDDGNWHLYIASDKFTADKPYDPYEEFVAVWHRMRDPMFDVFWVKVIGTDSRLAKAVMEEQRLYPGRIPLRVRDRALGGLMVEELYVYPPLTAAQAG